MNELENQQIRALLEQGYIPLAWIELSENELESYFLALELGANDIFSFNGKNTGELSLRIDCIGFADAVKINRRAAKSQMELGISQIDHDYRFKLEVYLLEGDTEALFRQFMSNEFSQRRERALTSPLSIAEVKQQGKPEFLS